MEPVTPSPKDLARVAARLARATRDDDRYGMLQTLGQAKAVQYRAVVEPLLHAPDDPLVAKMALQVLCVQWGDSARYLPQVLAFLRGVEWDTAQGGHVILVAIGIAGEYLRLHPHPDLLHELIDIYTNEESVFRDAAYVALARTLNHSWARALMKQVPPEKLVRDARARLDRELGRAPVAEDVRLIQRLIDYLQKM